MFGGRWGSCSSMALHMVGSLSVRTVGTASHVQRRQADLGRLPLELVCHNLKMMINTQEYYHANLDEEKVHVMASERASRQPHVEEEEDCTQQVPLKWLLLHPPGARKNLGQLTAIGSWYSLVDDSVVSPVSAPPPWDFSLVPS